MSARQTGGGRLSCRLRRERRTLEVMLGMYCREHHAPVSADDSVTTLSGTRLCPDCAALLDYAGQRLDACRFGEQKPTCARCTVHCFRAAERERVRTVMRYSGPRMMFRHPYLAVCHLSDRRHAPEPAA